MVWNNGVIFVVIVCVNIFAITQATNQAKARTEWLRIRCTEVCHDLERRECLSPPVECGKCIANHVDIDGSCKPESMEAAEDVPRSKKYFHEELERQRKALVQSIQLGDAVAQQGPETDVQRDLDRSHSVVPFPDTFSIPPSPHVQPQGGHPSAATYSSSSHSDVEKAVIIGVISALAAAALIGIIVAIICCCRLHRSVKDADDVDYVSYGATQHYPDVYATKAPSADRKLAQSAQMFHYQHVKQQLLELEKAQEVAAQSESGSSSGDETEEGKCTVYECPGLAEPGDMEVRNPLYSESPTVPLTNGGARAAAEPPTDPPEGQNGPPRSEPTLNGHKDA